MRHVEVEIALSELEREWWRFLYNPETHMLRCTDWALFRRESKRHKFKIVDDYDFYRNRREPHPQPEIPQNVAQSAMELFVKGLSVGHFEAR